MKLKVGNDNGNSAHKIIINNELFVGPNVFAKVRAIPEIERLDQKKFIDNIMDHLIVTINSKYLSVGNYICGHYALEGSNRPTSIKVGAVNSKLKSDVPLVNTLGRIAGYAVKKAYEQDPELIKETIEVSVDMATELPVKQASEANKREFAKKFMYYESDNKKYNLIHIITVHLPNRTVEVKIDFNFVDVLPEAVPAVFRFQRLGTTKDENEIKKELQLIKPLLTFNPDLEKHLTKEVTINGSKVQAVNGNYFRNLDILHGSIGEGTSEFPLTKDIYFDPNFIFGEDTGVGHAIKSSLPEFKKEFQLRTYSRQNFSEQLRNPEEKYHEEATEIFDHYLEAEADDILHYLQDEAEKANNQVDLISIYGGGSCPMEKHLKAPIESFGKNTRINVLYVPEAFAVELEAWGLWEFVNSNIFNMAKEYFNRDVKLLD